MTTWNPRTPLEQLIQVDTLLADIVPHHAAARERIVDTLPGHSGRPAGTGEPGGGRGASSSTVVERTQATWSRDAGDLVLLDELTGRVVDRVVAVRPAGVPGPVDNGAGRRLAWARWMVRQLIDHDQVSRFGRRGMLGLHRDVEQLHRIVTIWRSPRQVGARSPELAADATEQWCRSCLRVGARNHRCERYTSMGLCRWCGDFRAEQGFLPTLEIVDAHESGQAGSTIAKMIRDERKARGPRRPGRRRKDRP